MIKESLKPLEWQETEIDGKHFSWIAKSALHDYQILYDHTGKEYAAFYYERITEDRGSKRGKSVDELKQWAEGVHYPSKMAEWLNPDPLTETVNWFKVAKPEPTDKDKTTQLACVFEEVAELAFAVGLSSAVGDKLLSVSYELKTLSHEQAELFVKKINNIEALDATTDTKVTLAGFEYMMGYNGNGALKEVNASNWSKFVDGKAVTDENGKIVKGSDYFKPQLEKYLGGSND